MKSMIKKICIILAASQTIFFGACAGPANVSVGVGVGVPRPYGVPPAGGTIWIGRPSPRVLYDHLPVEQNIHYGQNNISVPDSGTGQHNGILVATDTK